MALTTIGQGTLPSQTVSLLQTNLLIDAAGEEVAFICRASKTGALRKFWFRTGTVTTGATLRGSVQTVDTSTGDPDGTEDAAGTVVLANSDDSVWKSVTFSSDLSVTRNDLLAFVLAFDGAAGNLNIACAASQIFNNIYCDHQTGGAWAKQARAPLIVPEYADGSTDMMPGCNAAVAVAVDFGSSSNPNEAGNRLTLTVPMAVRGVSFLGRLAAQMDIVIYDNASNQLATSRLEAAVKVSPEANYYAPFDDVELQPGTYRVTLKPTTASTIRRLELSYPTATAIEQDEFGTAFCATSRTGGGGWTNNPSARTAIQLYASKINDAAIRSGFRGANI